MLRSLFCPGLTVCLQAVCDRVVLINFELLKVKDIIAEASFFKKHPVRGAAGDFI